MRFFADGPSIPPELLDARDNGEVVFFCGAGVSMPAGLPSFARLAQQVIQELGVPQTTASRRTVERFLQEDDKELLPPMDQIFATLQREYGVALVEESVKRKLKTSKKANISYHKTVLRLSSDVAGAPRLVTTNFDLLFESADRKIKWYAPPALPDLSQEHHLDGMVYLHGRLDRRATQKGTSQGLILGSADFGRAYLADGWASRFLRSLLSRYTVILLGYSADDPPVRYLLEGLHSMPAGSSQRLYAFSEGRAGENDARWWDRGVRAISYQKADDHHSTLWKSLEAWAQRATNPEIWRTQTLDLARRGPLNLAPHERGQVAAMVRSAIGAKALAESNPPPPAEWLCVLDASIRYAEPQAKLAEEEKFDPLESYGLDDDAPRPPTAPQRHGPRGDDFLSPLSPNERGPNHTRLAGVFASRADPLPPRLFHIARWISRVAEQPAALWWAAGNHALHHSLQEFIEWAINRSKDKPPLEIQNAWKLLFEASQYAPGPYQPDWFDLERSLKEEGWTKRNSREFERIMRPHLRANRPHFGYARPPQAADANSQMGNLIGFDVVFPSKLTEKLEIPDAALSAVVSALRKSLEYASSLLEEIQYRWWKTPTLHPEERPGDRYLSESDALFLWFARLFATLCDIDPREAQRELTAWPERDQFFFNKLRVWVCMKNKIVESSEAAAFFTQLPSDAFWQTDLERELLWSLRSRWADFTDAERDALEARIVEGRLPYANEDAAEYPKSKAVQSAVRLGWLQNNGCTISAQTLLILPQLKAADPRWKDTWEQHADDSLEGRSGVVRHDTDPAKIIDLPVGQVIAQIQKSTRRPLAEFVEHDPFQGLVETKPARALATLAFEARHQRFPIEFWRTVLSEWPETAPLRATWLLANRIAQLSKTLLVELRYYAPRWMEKHLPPLFLSQKDLWKVWDSMLDALIAGGAEASVSSIGETTIGGVTQQRSRRTLDYAINSPVGNLMECLLIILGKCELKKGHGIPEGIKIRMERAMTAPGEGADHAITILASRLQYLFWLDPKWTDEKLVPLFSSERDAEPAFGGWLFHKGLPPPALFKRIKTAFLSALAQSSKWHWGDRASERMAQFLVAATIWSTRKRKYLSLSETRDALRLADDESRLAALSQLHLLTSDKKSWKKTIRPFLEKAWPKEARYQTEATARQLVMIISNTGTDFPQAVRALLPLLRPTDQLDLFIFHLKEMEGKQSEPLAKLFPKEAIELLDKVIADNPNSLPYDLGNVLEMVADANPSLRQDLRWRRLNSLLIGQ